MKIMKSRLIQGTDAIDTSKKFARAMAELSGCNPTFDKLDDCTMLIRYEEELRNTAKAIPMKPKCTAPCCKDCINFRSNEGMVRADKVTWGRCTYLLDAAVNGNKPLCRHMSESERKGVQIVRQEQTDKICDVQERA